MRLFNYGHFGMTADPTNNPKASVCDELSGEFLKRGSAFHVSYYKLYILQAVNNLLCHTNVDIERRLGEPVRSTFTLDAKFPAA